MGRDSPCMCMHKKCNKPQLTKTCQTFSLAPSNEQNLKLTTELVTSYKQIQFFNKGVLLDVISSNQSLFHIKHFDFVKNNSNMSKF